jgi:flagellar protein FlgJ
VVQSFRAYASYAEAFADWAKLVTRSPRYAKAVAAGDDAAGFARGLQAGGYATDPAYADKLTRVLNHALLKRAVA